MSTLWEGLHAHRPDLDRRLTPRPARLTRRGRAAQNALLLFLLVAFFVAAKTGLRAECQTWLTTSPTDYAASCGPLPTDKATR